MRRVHRNLEAQLFGQFHKKTKLAQYHYHDWHGIFLVDPSDHPRLVEITEAYGDTQLFLPAVSNDLLLTLEVYGIRNREGVIMGFIGLSD